MTVMVCSSAAVRLFFLDLTVFQLVGPVALAPIAQARPIGMERFCQSERWEDANGRAEAVP